MCDLKKKCIFKQSNFSNQMNPKIKIEPSKSDRALKSLTLILLVAIWIAVLINYSGLPEIIPIHFNLYGEADGFGNKGFLFLIPILATIIFIGITWLSKHPHIFNYPIKITEENALRQYKNATALMRFLNLFTVIAFGIIVIEILMTAKHQAQILGGWLIPTIFILIFPLTLYFIIKAFKLK